MRDESGDDSGFTRMAFTARIALLQEELSRKAERAERLETQVAEMVAFRDEAISARARLEDLRAQVVALEDSLLKARKSASNTRAELRPRTTAGQEQLVEDATAVAEFLERGTISAETRPALRRLIAA